MGHYQESKSIQSIQHQRAATYAFLEKLYKAINEQPHKRIYNNRHAVDSFIISFERLICQKLF